MVGDLEGVGSGRFGDVNQAVMELGATVCVPGVPRCGECPVRGFCVANKEGREGELPVKGKKRESPVVRGVALVVVREKQVASSKKQEGGKGERGTRNGEVGDEEVLLMQRGAGGVWEGMWEFPVVGEDGVSGFEFREGKTKKNDEKKKTSCVPVYFSTAQKNRGRKEETSCVPVSFLEGLGVRVGDMWECGEVVHVLTHRRMELRVVRVRVGKGIKKQGARSKKGEGEVRGEEEGFAFPVGVDGVGYVGMRWVGWPLERGGELPLARVVWKVAEKAGGQ